MKNWQQYRPNQGQQCCRFLTGMLLDNVTIEKMMEGYSRPRNPAIASAFAYMKIIEKWGTGIPRLFEAYEEYGLPKPELV